MFIFPGDAIKISDWNVMNEYGVSGLCLYYKYNTHGKKVSYLFYFNWIIMMMWWKK